MQPLDGERVQSYWWKLLVKQEAYMLHWSSMVSSVMPKYVEALPLLRLMCGTREGMDLQQGFIGAMLRNMADDGLVNLNQRNLVTDQYACELKGHTAVRVQPLPRDGVPSRSWYRIFRCEKLRAELVIQGAPKAVPTGILGCP